MCSGKAIKMSARDDEDMMKNDVIILSKSTLSVISCILTNQLALFSNQILPSKLKKYFKNIKEIKC